MHIFVRGLLAIIMGSTIILSCMYKISDKLEQMLNNQQSQRIKDKTSCRHFHMEMLHIIHFPFISYKPLNVTFNLTSNLNSKLFISKSDDIWKQTWPYNLISCQIHFIV